MESDGVQPLTPATCGGSDYGDVPCARLGSSGAALNNGSEQKELISYGITKKFASTIVTGQVYSMKLLEQCFEGWIYLRS